MTLLEIFTVLYILLFSVMIFIFILFKVLDWMYNSGFPMYIGLGILMFLVTTVLGFVIYFIQ